MFKKILSIAIVALAFLAVTETADAGPRWFRRPCECPEVEQPRYVVPGYVPPIVIRQPIYYVQPTPIYYYTPIYTPIYYVQPAPIIWIR